MGYSGLNAGTVYDAYCAQSGVLSEKVEFTAGVTAQPTISHRAAGVITLSTTFSGAGMARCVAVVPGGTAPTAAQQGKPGLGH